MLFATCKMYQYSKISKTFVAITVIKYITDIFFNNTLLTNERKTCSTGMLNRVFFIDHTGTIINEVNKLECSMVDNMWQER